MHSNPEINALKDRIRELEAACVHYKAQEDHLMDMLQRITAITEEMED